MDIEDLKKMTRIAVIDKNKCRPNKCNLECKKRCPVESRGKQCVDVTKKSKNANIVEEACIGCGMCEKVCPFDAIKIVMIPTNINKNVIHRFGENTYKLMRLPQPRKGKILGLIGSNGLGKSTILNILGGKIKINFGKYDDPPSDKEILDYFRGSDLQNYLSKEKKVVTKPQFIDKIPDIIKKKKGLNIKEQECKTTVREYLEKNSDRNPEEISSIIEKFELQKIQDRDIGYLSGGELQRFACSYIFLSKSDVYMFDEFTSFLDIKQRLVVSNNILELRDENNYVVIVEHDLSILDYLSDNINLITGEPGVYGVVSTPLSVNHGINVFLKGYIPNDNLRFREEPFVFEKKLIIDKEIDTTFYNYPNMVKKLGDFELNIEGGTYSPSCINVLLGENGVGKTTFIKLLAGTLSVNNEESDESENIELDNFIVSYKSQDLSNNSELYVSDLLGNKLGDATFVSQVIKPLELQKYYKRKLNKLSGGELQKVMIAMCLSKEADMYLLDEPSAFLDAESRIIVSKILKRFFINNKKIAFVVEHDLLMITYLADKIILFEGEPGIKTFANKPVDASEGMNKFLSNVGITIRKDPTNNRPRINKYGSMKDTEQKNSGLYYNI